MKVLGDPDITYLAIHHTAVPASSSQINAVNTYHQGKWNKKSSLGWYIGYNFFCDVNGNIVQTRAIGEETVANKGHNCDVPGRCDTVSFCFAGDFNRDLPNERQIKSFRKWHLEYQDHFVSKVVGHRDLQINRTCPGELITDQYIRTTLLGNALPPDSVDKEKAKQLANILEQVSILQKVLNLLRRYV